jgi:hypothetical protein
MRYATLRGEKSVGELVNRLYQLSETKLSTAATKSPAEIKTLIKTAEEGLRRANPELANLDKTVSGLVVIVPPVDGLKPTPAALPMDTPAEDTLAEIREDVADDLKTLDASANQEMSGLRALAKALKSDPDWKPLQQFSNFEAVKADIRADIEERLKDLDEMRASLKRILKQQLEDDLNGFSQGLQQ